MRIVLAGASGFIGQYLESAFRTRGDEVLRIGRSGPDATWGDPASIRRALDGADLLINLAGRSVNCRYGPPNRREILRSRVDTTEALAGAIATAEHPPALWINSSTATIYRHADDVPQTESTGELGEGFSVSVAKAWEQAFFDQDLPGTRRVALRIAIVLGRGSVLTPFVRLARFGLGGPQWDGRWPATRARRDAGTHHAFRTRWGRQRFSWIHIADVLGVIDFVVAHPELDGVVNASAPNPTDSVGLMRAIRRAIRMPFGVPTPRFVLEIGSAIIRTETELVLKSRWVLPERLLAAGYSFQFSRIDDAIDDLVP